jgi:hypothetical protein
MPTAVPNWVRQSSDSAGKPSSSGSRYEIERGMERLVILRIRRDVGLRAGLLLALGLEVSAQRSLPARVGARLVPRAPLAALRYRARFPSPGSSVRMG